MHISVASALESACDGCVTRKLKTSFLAGLKRVLDIAFGLLRVTFGMLILAFGLGFTVAGDSPSHFFGFAFHLINEAFGLVCLGVFHNHLIPAEFQLACQHAVSKRTLFNHFESTSLHVERPINLR